MEICAECRETGKNHLSNCKSGLWSVVTKQATSRLRPNKRWVSQSADSDKPEELNLDMLRVIYRLAVLVGQSGDDSVRRILKGFTNRSSKTYEAELNRLTKIYLSNIRKF